ncbi:MAG: SxtJ family membrane protein [Rhodospirillaceae bacterium]|nr:SxtJ family membrane protein [Rhodospirillaceae bacterium]
MRWWSLIIAGVFLALAFAAPKLLSPLNRLWMRFGLLLHRIVNPLVMALLFFLVVTPIALLMRLFGKRPLHLETEPDAESYWIPRDPPGPEPETMKQQF